MSDLFVGLVTHLRSRFNADGFATRQAQAIVDGLLARGLSADLLVSDRDDYDSEDRPLTRWDLVRSASYWSDLEYRWRRYLAEAGGRPARSAIADEALRLAMTVKRASSFDESDAIRLLNIDLSHLRVLDEGGRSGARWTLVLEDDARTDDMAACVDRIVEAIDAMDIAGTAFANLSESLSYDELGIEGIVGGRAQEPIPDWLVGARRPVTNTVCANLYRSGFATQVAEGIRHRGLVPVAPIDWRLNEQIMGMHRAGLIDRHSCLWARPGLFRQGSMHGVAP